MYLFKVNTLRKRVGSLSLKGSKTITPSPMRLIIDTGSLYITR